MQPLSNKGEKHLLDNIFSNDQTSLSNIKTSVQTTETHFFS